MGSRGLRRGSLGWLGIALAMLAASCVDSGGRDKSVARSTESCMTCHNGSQQNDYSGPGLEDPHPFGTAANLRCTECHGGNPDADEYELAHVPAPPEIGDRENWETNATAYFNRLTLTGIDKFDDYTVDGVTYSPIDWLQFVNPGDLRVVNDGRSCGQCHAPHAEQVSGSLLATEAGVLSGAMYTAGADNEVPESDGLHYNTAVDKGFRALQDPDPGNPGARMGAVARLLEFPVFSARGNPDANAIQNNPAYDAANINDDVLADGRVASNSELANLYHEQIAFTCGDCHLGSAGANNRYGDFRSSGCTSCHMQYSLSGRSTSGDPNVNLFEPADPDDIDEPELPHIARHLIRSVAKELPSGEFVPGIDDYACAGCHQGSNRTVMQYWGIRLDQNQDVRRGVQYPANPVSYATTSGDTRLFDPVVRNNTFNGRNRNQYLLFEDYDGDGRDDTPADVHYDAGMGCIDCHGSYDLHGGDVNDPDDVVFSRMEQAVAITCESCHGSVDAYAPVATGTNYDGDSAQLAMDGVGNPLRHVERDGSGNYWLTSRLTGNRHYIKQTRDTTVDTGVIDPDTGDPVYSVKASYAMGRDDGDAGTGIGPHQTGAAADGFSHADDLSCASCHSSWTNSCIGCHLEGEYNNGNNFSNITGERIVFREDEADFVYQSPIPFQLGIGPSGKVEPIVANTDAFFQWEDRNNDRSDTFAFSDRNGNGNNTARAQFPALAHNTMMQHSIRGKVDSLNEGPRYCVACHLTEDGLAAFGTEYDTFRAQMAANDFGNLDYAMLQTHIGRNTGNQMDSPMWVHQVAGLGSGLFLFDEEGCPTNPLDADANRKGCDDGAPSANFDPADVAFNMDRIVDPSGLSASSNSHPLLDPAGALLRDGALQPNMAGPLGATLILRLADPVNGIVLDSWFDADGEPQGDAETHTGP